MFNRVFYIFLLQVSRHHPETTNDAYEQKSFNDCKFVVVVVVDVDVDVDVVCVNCDKERTNESGKPS